MVFPVLPQPRGIKDWQQWGQLLVQALSNSIGTGGAATGIPTATGNGVATSYGGLFGWSTMSPGEFTIFTKSIQSDSLVFIQAQSLPLGTLYEDKSMRNPGVSFTIKSTDPTDAPDVAWLIVKQV